MAQGENKDPAEIQTLVTRFDHHCPAFKRQRLAFYDHLHANCPVLRSEAYGGLWYFGDYDDVMAVQRAPDDFSNRMRTIPAMSVAPLIPSSVDSPLHDEYKRMLTPFFTPHAVGGHFPMIAARIEDLLEYALGRGAFDIVTDVMQPLVATITLGILGLEESKAEQYARTIHNGSLLNFPREQADRDMAALLEDVMQSVRAVRGAPGKGLLAELCRVEFQNRPLTERELQLITMNLLTGGLGTTPLFVGSAVVTLFRNPEDRARLAGDPSLLPDAFEELLRFAGPVQVLVRLARTDVDVGPVRLRGGDQVLLGVGSANFDPDKFEDPHRINLDRKPNKHMSMGLGAHRCLGVHLAKAVSCEVLRVLLERAPDYRVVEDELGAYEDIANKFGYYKVPLLV